MYGRFGYWGFGRFGRGRRMLRKLLAVQRGDPDRALFGMGPCGEIAYRMYKESKSKETKDSSGQN